MLRNCSFAVLGAAFGALLVFCQSTAPAPRIDKQKVESYLRYAEAFTPEVKIAVDDPAPSPFPGYFRVLIHLTAGTHKLDRVYYLSADGQELIAGNIWSLNNSPFTDTLAHLPAGGPSLGSPNAKITIFVFSDFECPYCRELAKTIRDNVPQKYPNDVRVVFEDFPIDSIHKWARAASEAAHCIESQKPAAFWTFHDWVFEHQQELNENNLRDHVLAFAKQQNLDASQVASCIDTHATAQQVNQAQLAGAALQISKTPTLFVNGRMVDGSVPWATLDRIINIELNRPKEITSAGTEKCCEVTVPSAVQK